MNGRPMGSPLGLERVPLTEAEIEHLAPIVDRWEAAQKEMQAAQRDVDAVIKLYRAQHKQELTEGPEWQLSRDAFVRQMPPRVEQPVNGDGELERQVAALMEG